MVLIKTITFSNVDIVFQDQLAARRLKDEILSGMTGETYSELMSNLGRLTAARKMERYGVTQGLPFSRQRWAQCYGLEWHRYPELRRLSSFTEDRVQWRAWFHRIEEGKNIYQALLAKIDVEQTQAFADLTPAATRFLLTRC